MRTYRRNSANSLFAGFTLVEILIVIVIIGLLAGMTTTVVVSARRSVNNSIITSQMAQLSIALDEYKNKFGEYPPDLSDRVAVERHLKKRWPRYNVTYERFLDHIGKGCALSSSNRYVWDIRAYVSPLIFWLGGLPDEHGVPSGFYASPKCPLGITVSDNTPIARPERAKKEKPFYTFDRKYLGVYESAEYPGLDCNYCYKTADVEDIRVSEEGPIVYIPAYCQGDYPIVYFRPSVNVPYGGKFFYLAKSRIDERNIYNGDEASCAVPYMQNADSWYEEKRFQLVHPGDDGLFSLSQIDFKELGLSGDLRDVYESPRVVPTKSGTTLRDADNLTNFITGGTLESLYD